MRSIPFHALQRGIRLLQKLRPTWVISSVMLRARTWRLVGSRTRSTAGFTSWTEVIGSVCMMWAQWGQGEILSADFRERVTPKSLIALDFLKSWIDLLLLVKTGATAPCLNGSVGNCGQASRHAHLRGQLRRHKTHSVRVVQTLW